MSETNDDDLKQKQVLVLRKVLGKTVKGDDLEVHICMATLDGVTVLDIREYVPSLGVYGRGTTQLWNTETLRVMRTAFRNVDPR